eukprot:c25516_g1_i2 orf=724-2439(-)
MSVQEHCCEGTFWLYILIITGLVLFAGLMSGLTLGLMSLGLVDLEVLTKSGTPADRRHAAKILPVVKNQHLLLCTLLIGNSLAMEALPIFLDTLVSAWGAILISVTLILMFGEIFPQAVCSRYGLAVGATMVPIVRVLVFLFFPVTYPISKLLDHLLGKGHVALFRRAELKTLVNMHGNEAGKGGELTHDETTIIAGALELTAKTAKDAMTPISEAFAIDVNAKLDMKTMNLIMTKGHSRVPVYSGNPTNIIGLILVKNLLSIRPEDEIPVRNVTIRKIPRVRESMPLYDILNEFQKGHSHMAAVVKCTNDKVEYGNRGKDMKGLSEKRLSNARNKRRNSDANAIPGVPAHKAVVVDIQADNTHDSFDSSVGLMLKYIPSSELPVLKGDSEGATMENVYVTQRVKKWERTRAEDILDIGQESLPSFPQDEEVIGIITMEDVIEELLQEEILDETDEYIDVHNKIKVNMLPPGGRSPISPVSSTFPTAAASPLSFQQTPPLSSPIASFQGTPIPDSPSSPHLQVPKTTPTVSVSPNVSVSASPPTFFLSSEHDSSRHSGSKGVQIENMKVFL